MKATLFLTFVGSSLAISSTGTATDKRSESGHLNHFIPNGIPSVRLGDLKLPDGQPISEGLPIPSDLPVPIGLPNTTTPFPFPGSIESDAPGNKSIHHRRQLFGMTENGVTMSTGCQPLTFIFARGTGEPGNMGIVVGPPVASALRSLTGSKVAVQGVNYDASVMGDATAGADGGPVMAQYVQQALQKCPKTKVVLGGYSEGSMVVHNAANGLSAGQVAGAVLFGDPFKMFGVGKLAPGSVREFCALGDPVCENGFNVLAHVSYGADAQTAAQFLIKAAGV